MRKGVKALSVLLLFCVLLSFTGCGDKDKIIGKWKQSSYNSGYSVLKDEFGEVEFSKNGKYKKACSLDHVGFSNGSTYESGTFKIDDKAGQIMFYPDDGSYGSNCFIYSYSISSDQLTIRSLNGSDIVYLKK